MDTEYTSTPICPHCGHAHDDWIDWFRDGNLHCEGAICDECGHGFEISMHISHSFTTWDTNAAQSDSLRSSPSNPQKEMTR